MSFREWLAREWVLMRAETWAPNVTGTKDDPRCAETLRKLTEARERMDRLHIPRMLKGKPLNMHGTDIQQTFDAMKRLKNGNVRKVK